MSLKLKGTFSVYPSGHALLGVAVIVLLASALPVLIAPREGGTLAIIGAMCFAVAALPLIIRRKFYIFEPQVFVLLSVFMGATARSLYLLYSPAERVSALTDGTAPADLIVGSLAALLGLTFLSLGYISTTARVPVERWNILTNDTWSERRVWVLVVLSTVVSVIGFYLFARETGFSVSSIADISKKRYVELDVSTDGSTNAALSYLRFLASFSIVGFYALLAWIVTNRLNIRKKIVYGVAAAILFVGSALFPLVTSDRTAILIAIVGGIVLVGALRGRIAFGRLLIVLAGMIFIGIIMAQLRATREPDATVDDGVGVAGFAEAVQAAADKVVGSGNFFSIERTAIIVQRVPERLSYQYGSTYFAVAFAFVPRTMWPDKPTISLGGMVRSEIYGLWVGWGGFPPGFVGEAHMNLGWPGIVLFSFLTGVLLRIWFNSLKPLMHNNRNVALLYGGTIWVVGEQFVELNFSLALVNAVQAIIMILIAFFVLRASPSLRRQRVVP